MWQAAYFGLVIEPNDKIMSGLCKSSLTPEHLAVYWAGADALALPARAQLAAEAALHRMPGCRNDFCKTWKAVRLPANRHHQPERGKEEAALFTKPFLSRRVVYIHNPRKNVTSTSQGFLSSSSLVLGTEFKALFPPGLCLICHVFLPSTLLHTAAHHLSFERTWRAGGVISLPRTPYADCFYVMQTEADSVFRAHVTALPSLLAMRQKGVHRELEIMHFLGDSS